MNKLDLDYQNLLQDILDNGIKKEDRTGTGTLSVFGRTIRHDMKTGFPLLTTKRLYFKGITTELLWFLKGDTNIKFLVNNDCHIWDGDCYANYLKEHSKNPNGTAGLKNGIPFNKSEFIALIQTSNAFAKKWGELGPVYGAQWRNWRNGGDAYKKYWHEWKPTLEDCGLDLTPYTKEEFINRIKTDDEFAKKWRAFDEDASGGIDQITNLIRDLKTNPDSRRLIVNAWAVHDLPNMVLPPCHYGFQVYTRELSVKERMEIYFKQHPDWAMIGEHSFFDKHNIPSRAISLMWNQRSVDTFLGLPFNIASYGLLLEIIAKAVNMVPDELIGNLGDTHLYSNHIEQAEEQISRTPYALPKVNINTEFWPTESGECGVGPIDAIALFNSFADDNFCKCLLQDIQLGDYQSHPTIKAPLSN